MILSDAARRNWERLHPDPSLKLKRGANKTLSVKRICPGEYVTSAETGPFLRKILSICDEEKLSAETVVFSLAVRMLEEKGLLHAAHVRQTLQPYDALQVNGRIHDLSLPSGERDIPGIVYQTLLTEGEKNISGAYYTPFHVISGMLANVGPDDHLFLDPCCGSGAFLLSFPAADPDQIWGCDRDPVAVLIAKVNLLCRYSDFTFVPHIFCCDFLSAPALSGQECELFRKRFDCIATNPPWGAKTGGSGHGSKDSSSMFFIKSFQLLTDGGKAVFLFPEALLNVRAHRNFREMLLREIRLKSIQFSEENFSGVMTKYVSIHAEKRPPARTFLIGNGKTFLKKRIQDILIRQERIISFSRPEDDGILRAIAAAKKYDLSSSIFALGIVTGNNREKLFSAPSAGTEPVYTGKEVGKYLLKKARNFIRYRRDDFQQAARDEYYRAPEKLVYRFVSRQLIFSFDSSKSLFLNSANILIPAIPGYTIKTALAFLNSEILCYYYVKSFRDIKILKGNLRQLPFPEINPEIRNRIDRIVDEILQGNNSEEAALQEMIYGCYRLTGDQVRHIRNAAAASGAACSP